MKNLLYLLFFVPCFCQAQEGAPVPRIENEALITTTGYKIHPGMQVKLGAGTMPDGDFKYIRINSASLFQYTGENRGAVNSANAMGRRSAGMSFKVIRVESRGNRKHGYVYYAIINQFINRYEIDVERAIASGELDVPEEFKVKTKVIAEIKQEVSVADEIAKLKKLKDEGVLTEEEYTAQKAKLLNK